MRCVEAKNEIRKALALMNQTIKVSVAVVLLAVSGFFLFRYMTKEGGHTYVEAYHWLCAEPNCGEGFSLAYKDQMALQNAGGAKCPKCGSPNVELAFQCPLCDGYYLPVGHATQPKNCPKCGGLLPLPKFSFDD